MTWMGWYPIEPDQPDEPEAPGPPPRDVQGPVLDAKHGMRRLHADPTVITYGSKSLALDEIEWVSYWATYTTEKRFMYPTTHKSEWDFEVGRYPYHGGPKIRLHFLKGGREREAPDMWTFLVNLVREHAEARLLGDLVEQARKGETVTIAGSVRVSLGGVACPKPLFSLPWEAIGTPRPRNGMIWIYRTDAEKPLLTVPLRHPNAGLIPALFAAVRP